MVWRRVHDSVLVRPRRAPLLRLAGSGAPLWDLLESPHSADELIGGLADQFGTTPEVVAEGLRAVLDRLVSAEVLKWC